MSQFIISIDQGTTSSRAVLFNKEGEVVDISQEEISQYYPYPGWVEEDAEEIYLSTVSVLKKLVNNNNLKSGDILSIGITNQRETTVIWNRVTGKPVYNAIVWQCKRSKDYCEALETQGFGDKIQKRTGLVIDPYFSGTKIKWILDNVEGAREKAERGDILFGTIDTWLLWKLTGGSSHLTDVSNASRTMLFNINSMNWDKELLELLTIPESILPDVKPNSWDFGYINEDILGFPIPVNAMIGDQQSALFGQLCTDQGDIKNTYGTGCFALMNIGNKPIISRSGLLTTVAWQIDSNIDYAFEGSVFVGGAVIQWLRDELGLIKYARESEEIAESVEDNNGVTFVSTFQGLGTPYWESSVKAEITGITRGCKRAHIVRAALESIAFRTMEVIDTMIMDSGLSIKQLKVDGGACQNNFLMNFQAMISSLEIIRPKNIESTALGAAYIAGLKSGMWKDIDELKALKKRDKTFTPIVDPKKREDLKNQWKKAIKKAIGG